MPDGPRTARASDADLAFLAMDRDAVPQQIAVVLILDRSLPEDTCVRLLGDRTATVPRLRQRLIRTPPGCGPPIWVDDDGFDPRRHVTTVPCAAPEDAQALLNAVLPHVLRPLPRDRPLWRAVLIRGPAKVAGLTLLELVDRSATVVRRSLWVFHAWRSCST